MFTRSLYLVGMTGCGKSTIGREVAKQLNFPFYDADREIETEAGLSISEIFEYEGEAKFRRLEVAAIDTLTQLRKVVLATGGGAILRVSTRKHLAHRGFVVYLNVPIATLIDRAEQSKNRPLLKDRDAKDVLTDMFEERNSLYTDIADVTFNTDLYLSVAEVATEIARWYHKQT